MPRLAIVLCLAAISTACLRSTTVISISPDGSGTIVQETGVSPQAMAMLQGMAAGGEQKGMPAEMFGEEHAQKIASTMGVRFVSGEPIKTAQLEGYRARFAFDDVRKLQMKMNQEATAALGGGKAGGEPPFGFGFERRGDSAILTITMPQEKPEGLSGIGAGMGGATAGETTPEQNAQALQMMKMMMQGMFVDISLEVDGRIIKTNAPHVDGSRLTLIQLDFDKLLADESGLTQLQKATDLQSLGNVAGLKVITDRTVTVEFAK